MRPKAAKSKRGIPPSAALFGTLLLLGSGGAARAQSNPTNNKCELGITLALTGKPARAESVFLSLLSQSPRDARAYNNLGNLHLLKGGTEVALQFYDRALSSDTTDAGIVLNQATALLLLGNEEAAEERASLGIRMAGSAPAAAHLLGLRYDGPERQEFKGSDRPYLSKEEVAALLRAAAGRVPSDSLRVTPPATGKTRGRKPSTVWRAAGPRAEDTGAPTALVYWKR